MVQDLTGSGPVGNDRQIPGLAGHLDGLFSTDYTHRVPTYTHQTKTQPSATSTVQREQKSTALSTTSVTTAETTTKATTTVARTTNKIGG